MENTTNINKSNDDSMEHFDEDDYIRTDMDYLEDCYTNEEDHSQNIIFQNLNEEEKLIFLIIKHNFQPHGKYIKKSKKYLNKYKDDPLLLVKCLIEIFKNNLHTLPENKKLAILIFVKNYFNKAEQKLKNIEMDRKRNLVVDNDASNEGQVAVGINKNKPILLIRQSNIFELIFIMIEKLNDQNNQFTNKVKLFIMDAIKAIISISDKLNIKNDSFFVSIFSRIKEQMIKNLDDSLNDRTLLNYLSIYEIVITSLKSLFYDTNDLSDILFLPEIILINFDKIKIFNTDRDRDMNKEKHVMDIEDIVLNQNKQISEFEISNNNIMPDYTARLKIVKSIALVLNNFIKNGLFYFDRNLKHSGFYNSNDFIFLNNIKFLEVIKYLIYLDTANSKDYKILIPHGSHEMMSLKCSILKKIKLSIKLVSKLSLDTYCPNFFLFFTNLYEDYLNAINEFNKNYNITMIKDDNIDDSDLNNYINSIFSILNQGLQLQIPSVMKIFYSNYTNIFRYIIVPSIRICLGEKEAFIIDAEEYNKFIYDFVYKFKSEIIKSKALKFLVKICEYISEFSEFVVTFCVELLIYALSLDNVQLSVEDLEYFKFGAILNRKNSIFHGYIETMSKEEIYEMALQMMATIQRPVFEHRNLFDQKDAQFYYLLSTYVFKNYNLSEFIITKVCMYCYSNIMIKLKAITKSVKSNDYQIQSLNKYNQILFNYSNYLFENIFKGNSSMSISKSNSNSKMVQKNLTFLVIELINDILFHKSFINHEIIKSFLNNLVILKIDLIQQILLKEDKLIIKSVNSVNSNQNFFYLIINLQIHYFTQIEKNIFTIFNYTASETFREIEKYYKHVKDTQNMRKCPRFCTPNTTENFVKCTIEILKKTQNLNYPDLILRENIFNKYYEVFLKNSKKFLNFNYEEDLMTINIHLINKIQITDNNYKNFVEDYFSEIKNQKFELKDYHVTYLSRIIELIINSNNLNLILKFKKDIFSFFSIGLGYYSSDICKCVLHHFYIISIFIYFVLNFSTLGERGNYLDIKDYENIISIIEERIRLKLNHITQGAFASRIYLLFHLVLFILFEENKMHAFLNDMNINSKLEFLFTKTFNLCGDHPTIFENSLTILYLFRHISLILNDSNSNSNFLLKLIEFTIQQVSFLSFKNIPQCEVNEQELHSIYINGSSKEKLTQIIPPELLTRAAGLDLNYYKQSHSYKSKKLFGIKNFDGVKDIEEECKRINIKKAGNVLNHKATNILYSNNNLDSDDFSSSDTEFLDDDSYKEDSSDVEYLEENSVEADDELFMLDFDNEIEFRKFNELMTLEKYLKRKRIEYTLKFVKFFKFIFRNKIDTI